MAACRYELHLHQGREVWDFEMKRCWLVLAGLQSTLFRWSKEGKWWWLLSVIAGWIAWPITIKNQLNEYAGFISSLSIALLFPIFEIFCEVDPAMSFPSIIEYNLNKFTTKRQIKA